MDKENCFYIGCSNKKLFDISNSSYNEYWPVCNDHRTVCQDKEFDKSVLHPGLFDDSWNFKDKIDAMKKRIIEYEKKYLDEER